MEWHVRLEAHQTGANIYVAGYLATCASARTEELIASLRDGTQVVRLDLRAVDIIDPTSFVVIVRALNRWRDFSNGGLHIQFPERSERSRRSHLHLVRDVIPMVMPRRSPITIFDGAAAECAAW
jgi:hypothetical protein